MDAGGNDFGVVSEDISSCCAKIPAKEKERFCGKSEVELISHEGKCEEIDPIKTVKCCGGQEKMQVSLKEENCCSNSNNSPCSDGTSVMSESSHDISPSRNEISPHTNTNELLIPSKSYLCSKQSHKSDEETTNTCCSQGSSNSQVEKENPCSPIDSREIRKETEKIESCCSTKELCNSKVYTANSSEKSCRVLTEINLSKISRNIDGQKASCCAQKTSNSDEYKAEPLCSSRKRCCDGEVKKDSCCSSKKSCDDKTGTCSSSVIGTVDSCCASTKITKPDSCCSSKKSCEELARPSSSTKSCSGTIEKTESCCSRKNTYIGEKSCASKSIKKDSSCCASKKSCSTGENSFSALEKGKCNENGQKQGCCSSKSSCGSQNKEPAPFVSTNVKEETTTVVYSIQGMTCTDCAARINSHLSQLPGIVSAEAQFMARKAYIEFIESEVSLDTIEKEIQNIQFQPTFLSSRASNDTTEQLMVTTTENYFPKDKILHMRGTTEVKKIVINENNIWVISFDQFTTNSRDIMEVLYNEMGEDNVMLYVPEESESGNSTASQWRNRFIISALLCLPILFLVYIAPELPAEYRGFVEWELFATSLSVILQWILTTPIQFILGYPIYKAAYASLRYEHKANMDVLIVISTGTAYWYSVAIVIAQYFNLIHEDTFFETAAFLMTLILLGRFLESTATSQTSRVLQELTSMQAEKAILVANIESDCNDSCCTKNEEAQPVEDREIDVRFIQVGDQLKVLPGMSIPVDGMVARGSSAVDESMVTGESKLVKKKPGSELIGGTINSSKGTLIMQVTKTMQHSTLSTISRLVEEAQQQKAKVERSADRVASVFVPVIIAIALVAFVVWYILAYYQIVETTYAPLTFALLFALTILVISCPCAVSLSVPTVVVVATGIAAKHGILFKGGPAIEQASKCKIIVFDKTGTLTQGNFDICNIFTRPDSKHTEFSLFELLGSIEASSEHPIGKAIVNRAKKMSCKLTEPTNFLPYPACGVQGDVEGHSVLVGKFSWVQNQCAPLSDDLSRDFTEKSRLWQLTGQTVVAIGVDGYLVGIIGMADIPRPEAQKVIIKLKEMGKEVFMLTGDEERTAYAIGESVGIAQENIYYGVVPAEKSDIVRQLQNELGSVVMIGDGINDAIALTAADIGIAVGSGTNVAIEAADIVLMKSDLWDVVISLHLALVSFNVIRLNFTWAFLYNLFGIPLAAGLLYPFFGISIPPALAGLSELLSSLPVVFFALAMGKLYQPPTQ